MRGAIISIMLIATGTASIAAQSGSLDRDRDPVVVTGAALPSMVNTAVNDIVAFRYEGGWQQIPVQIDERKFVEYRVVYDTTDPQIPAGLGTIAYADSTTYTGADGDPAFDANDELVLMAKDTGNHAPIGITPPPGVMALTGIEIEITDPLDAGVGYVYLFENDGTLSQNAGQDYVTYTFNLLAGPYIPNYKTIQGPNPEDSEAFSAYYRTHFSDRWIRDEIDVLTDGSSELDIFDRHKNMFAPGNCARTENTFSDAEGAFFTNKDGAVRAIRSYMGANSGPLTQREHLFYEQRQSITTFLRVHAINSVMDVYDYSPNATGMFYFNDLNLSGLLVDGQPEAAGIGAITWEMVTGTQGSMIMAHQIETDIDPFTYTSYYSDDDTPTVTQCTGDAFEYATSGIYINHSIPNTDPRQAGYKSLAMQRTVYYEPPGQSVETAQLRFSQAQTPLETSIQAYPLYAPGDFNHDDYVDAFDVELFLPCMTGAGVGPPADGCEDKDLDGDNDIDLGDFGIVQRCLSGSTAPADRTCAY